MSSSSPGFKIPLWVFVVMDVVLLGFATLIAARSARPWTEITIFAVAACVTVGAVVLLVPWLMHVERQKNEMLDDRQRALEALARTVSSSAEQISIATSGLNEIAEIAQRNLKHAEQLPHRLQEKIAEFQAQLANVNDEEKEELEKELEELRASETERMQSIADRIARTTGELAKLETSTHQHLIAANDALSKLTLGTASAIGKAQAAAEQALAQARQEAARNIADATGNAVKAIDQAKTAAVTDLTAQLDAGLGRLKETAATLSTLIAELHTASRTAVQPVTAPSATPVSETPAAPVDPAAPVTRDGEAHAAAAETPSQPAKRIRKARREEPVPEPAVVATAPTAPIDPTASTAALADVPPATEPAAVSEAPSGPVSEEPPPVTPERIPEVTPVAPNTPEPFPIARDSMPPSDVATAAAADPIDAAPAVATAEAPKPSRKRAPKKADTDQPALGLDIEEPRPENGEAAPGVVERVLTSDGATRLIVTAYIGIGNRLFIRGSGPGLSWDKGVPLQFVSIGKWRWETNDASAPVQFKLLKNDELESSALGTLTIEPGHQHEVTATFG